MKSLRRFFASYSKIIACLAWALLASQFAAGSSPDSDPAAPGAHDEETSNHSGVTAKDDDTSSETDALRTPDPTRTVEPDPNGDPRNDLPDPPPGGAQAPHLNAALEAAQSALQLGLSALAPESITDPPPGSDAPIVGNAIKVISLSAKELVSDSNASPRQKSPDELVSLIKKKLREDVKQIMYPISAPEGGAIAVRRLDSKWVPAFWQSEDSLIRSLIDRSRNFLTVEQVTASQGAANTEREDPPPGGSATATLQKDSILEIQPLSLQLLMRESEGNLTLRSTRARAYYGLTTEPESAETIIAKLLKAIPDPMPDE